MPNYKKFQSEDGKYFGLSWTSEYEIAGSGDLGLGRGSCQHTARFFSEEARDYFIQSREYEKALKSARWELECIKARIAECLTKTGRVRSKKLIRLASEVVKL